jgi:bifunctional non-homologous end joining protein LigD
MSRGTRTPAEPAGRETASAPADRADKLQTYRQKRDPRRTPEPIPGGPLPEGHDDTFVIQEHHARRLHWDVRLERHGVLVSWAVPKGLPPDPRTNHLAVHTEDHPIEYAAFEGEIPRGEYGGGKVLIWDRGRYELEKWTDREVKVVLRGSRVEGRYVFFQLRGADWMVHRMDPPRDPNWVPVPDHVRPMRGVPGDLPRPDRAQRWAYEMVWSGERALVAVDGGRARVLTATGADATVTYPELRAIGPALGIRTCIVDGEIVALDGTGRPNAARLRRRREAEGAAEIRRAAAEAPITYFAYDVLHLDGRDTTGLPYVERRGLLDGMDLRGPHWDVPPAIPDDGGEALAASRSLGLSGVIAKRADSPYEPGRRSSSWRVVSNRPLQTVVVGGWIRSAEGSDEPAGLLMGEVADGRLRYAGTVRIGLTTATRAELAPLLRRLSRRTSPFSAGSPEGHDVEWVRPILTGEVAFDGRTSDGRLRRPAWRRLL